MLLVTFVDLSAQEKQTIDGKEYYLHQVEQGVTLYSIAKKYNVKVTDIQSENPFLDAGLKLGQTLRIPIAKIEKPQIENDTIVPKGYMVHIVEEGETLYALSRKYKITVREILDKNPSVINGLQLGQRLLLPTKSSEKIVKQPITTVVDTDKYIKHTVDTGETLYSLSRLYEVSADSVMKLNNGLPKGLQLGMELIIPKIKPADVILVKEIMGGGDTLLLNDSVAQKNSYNIALILPLYIDTNQTLDETRREFDKDEVFPKSKIAIQFYQGVLLAVDSMRKQGVSVKLYVFDSANDTNLIKGLLNRPEMKEMHLIIGPLYRHSFMLAATFAKHNKISIVSPVPQSNKILLGNPYVSKVSASRMIQVERLAKFVIKQHVNDNMYVFTSNDAVNSKFSNYFQTIASKELDSLKNAPIDSVREVGFAAVKAKKMEILLDSTVNNIIIIPSNDQAFVSECLTQLNQLTSAYKIVVYGLDKWKNFENISTEYMHSLNVHITSPTMVDYHAKTEGKYMRAFRLKYSTDPTMYGFTGFDVAYYYLGMLDKYGTNFQSHLPELKHQGIVTSFDFYQTSIESGFENYSVHILKYENYKLIEVK